MIIKICCVEFRYQNSNYIFGSYVQSFQKFGREEQEDWFSSSHLFQIELKGTPPKSVYNISIILLASFSCLLCSQSTLPYNLGLSRCSTASTFINYPLPTMIWADPSSTTWMLGILWANRRAWQMLWYIQLERIESMPLQRSY